VLVAFCVEMGRFDGQRHLTNKIDATSWVWISDVEQRALGACIVLLVAAPLGAAVGRSIGARRGALWGLAALGPFGACMLLSSALLVRSYLAILGAPDADVADKLALLESALSRSDHRLHSTRVSAMAATKWKEPQEVEARPTPVAPCFHPEKNASVVRGAVNGGRSVPNSVARRSRPRAPQTSASRIGPRPRLKHRDSSVGSRCVAP
jgi:hypothetical protein